MRTLSALACLLVACSPAADDPTEGPAATTDLSTSTGPADPTTAGPGTTADASDSVGTVEPPNPTAGETTDATTDATTGVPAGPCGEPPPFTGAMAQTISAAGLDRSYILVVPEDYDPNRQYPLVFAWHGRGGNAELARLYFKVEEAAGGDAIFVYPNGLPLPEMDNQTGWDLTAEGEDVALFDAIFVDVSARLCTGPVFSTGHSFGGYMSNVIGCYRGGTVRAIAPVAGGGPFGGCKNQTAAWVAHGTADSVVPFSQGEGSRDHWLDTNHCTPETAPVEPPPCVAYTCDALYPVHWCEHSEADLGGHGWPTWAGPAIWAFFAGL